MGFFQFGVTLVALALAFLVGRLTASGADHPPPPPPGLGGPSIPIRPDAPELVQKVEQVFADGIKDQRWSDDEDFKFRTALLKLGREGQLKELAIWVQAVNTGKLKLADPDVPAPPPACCTQCTTLPRGADQGSAAKKSAPAAK